MTTIQRIKSDIATRDRRAITDQTVNDDRNRNDDLTRERRDKADKTIMDSRTRNDEKTAHRRRLKDGSPILALAVVLLLLVVLFVGLFLVFV